jgi:hypothetical protein
MCRTDSSAITYCDEHGIVSATKCARYRQEKSHQRNPSATVTVIAKVTKELGVL